MLCSASFLCCKALTQIATAAIKTYCGHIKPIHQVSRVLSCRAAPQPVSPNAPIRLSHPKCRTLQFFFFLLSIMRLLVNLLLQCPEDPWCNTPVLQSIRYFSKNLVFPTSLLKFHSISSSRGSIKTWHGTMPEEYCFYTAVRTSSYWLLLFQSINPDSSSSTLQYIHSQYFLSLSTSWLCEILLRQKLK